MNDNDVKGGRTVLGLVLIGLAILAVVGWGLGWFSLATQRPMAKYAEETRKEVYDTSRQYQQGANRDIARYCEQMRTAREPSARRAVAALIRSTADTYDGPLSQDNTDCLNEAKGS